MIFNINIQNISNKKADNNDQNNLTTALLPVIVTAIAAIFTEVISSDSTDIFPVTIKYCILYSAVFLSIIAALLIIFYFFNSIYKCLHKQLTIKFLILLFIALMVTIFLCDYVLDIYTTLPSPSNSSVIYEELLNRIPFNV